MTKIGFALNAAGVFLTCSARSVFFTDEEVLGNSKSAHLSLMAISSWRGNGLLVAWKVANIDFKQIICVCG